MCKWTPPLGLSRCADEQQAQPGQLELLSALAERVDRWQQETHITAKRSISGGVGPRLDQPSPGGATTGWRRVKLAGMDSMTPRIEP